MSPFPFDTKATIGLLFVTLINMRKAIFIPFEKKKDDQIAFEASLTGQERIDRMFELIDATMHLQKKFTFIPSKNSITLKRKK